MTLLSKKKPVLSIITPVHNQSAYTRMYLTDILPYLIRFGGSVELIIVDNGSRDETEQVLAQNKIILGDLLTVESLEENKGFGIANNIGAGLAKGNKLLLLNNDVRIHGDIFTPVCDSLEENPYEIIGPDYQDRFNGWNKFGDTVITYIAAWCLGITKDSFWALGGFDDAYSPAYFEDVDLCYKAQLDGFALKQMDLPIAHISGMTGGSMEGRETLTLRNQQYFSEKWELGSPVGVQT